MSFVHDDDKMPQIITSHLVEGIPQSPHYVHSLESSIDMEDKNLLFIELLTCWSKSLDFRRLHTARVTLSMVSNYNRAPRTPISNHGNWILRSGTHLSAWAHEHTFFANIYAVKYFLSDYHRELNKWSFERGVVVIRVFFSTCSTVRSDLCQSTGLPYQPI